LEIESKARVLGDDYFNMEDNVKNKLKEDYTLCNSFTMQGIALVKVGKHEEAIKAFEEGYTNKA
jgi:hypothetical protein